MKGILVFSELNDIVFLNADREFKTHINARALEAELIQPEDLHKDVDANVAVQLFSPIINSQRFMIATVKNPYSSIKCENGFLFVFKQFGTQLHLAINGDGKETEEFLIRKLLVFQKLLGFHFGPVDEQIRPDNVRERKELWEQLSSVIDTWCHLVSEEQAFLVEAYERLNVNQVLNTTCIDVLENSLMKIKDGGDKRALHSLLLVNSKLLALFSSRNACELQSSDILLIILLVQSLFPNASNLDDLLSTSYRQDSDDQQASSQNKKKSTSSDHQYSKGDESTESENEYYDTEDIQDRPAKTSDASELTAEYHDALLDAVEVTEEFHTPMERDPGFFQRFQRPSEITDTSSSQDGSSSQDTTTPPKETQEYQQRVVFLQTPTCQFTPHVLYCIQIVPGIVIVIISEVAKGNHSGIICPILGLLKTILNSHLPGVATDTSHIRFTHEQIDANIKRLSEATKKYKGTIEKVVHDIESKWATVKKDGLLMQYMEQKKKKDIPAKLDSLLSAMMSRLKALFRLLYLTPRQTDPRVVASHEAAVSAVQAMVRKNLRDYKDYLAVKAQRNITMTNYLEDFPGLVHFIYIDRFTDQITAPSINIASDEDPEKMDTTKALKEKIWKMIHWAHGKLQQGHVSMTMRDGDFFYSYILWFEDSSGNPLSPTQPFHGMAQDKPPGILADNFYRTLIRHCFPNLPRYQVRCYELLCIHIGLVPAQYVLEHCKRLAGSLWETTEVFW